MGCVSSTLEDEFRNNHIFSLTSTTYALLDPPSSDDPSPSPTTPPTPHPRFTLASLLPQPTSLPPPQSSKPLPFRHYFGKENFTPNKHKPPPPPPAPIDLLLLHGFEKLCPPKGDNRLVLYTTTLRGVRKTFDACNAVRAAIQGLGFFVSERDISMDRGFKDELTELMTLTGKGHLQLLPPRLFVKGRYIGGVEEVMKVLEEGNLGKLLQGLPRFKAGHVCQGCGGVQFLPCFTCNGSCKLVMAEKEEEVGDEDQCRKTMVVPCSDCNENGLMLCPICG